MTYTPQSEVDVPQRGPLAGKRKLLAVPVAGLVALSVWLASGGTPVLAGQVNAAADPPACAAPPPPQEPSNSPGPSGPVDPSPTTQPEPQQPEGPEIGPTTTTTVGQAYFCILANSYYGDTLDNRTLLTAAFAALAVELNKHGQDSAVANVPAFTGDNSADWAAFAAVYDRALANANADLKQAVGAAAIKAMVASLHENHTGWQRPIAPPPGWEPGMDYGLGLVTNWGIPDVNDQPEVVTGPLYVTGTRGGPAKAAGLKPGDVIESVNGSAPFVDGVVSAGTLQLLNPQYPAATTVKVQVFRPATGKRWTVTLKPGLFTPEQRAMVTSKLLPGNVAYVSLAGFGRDAADQVIAAIKALKPSSVVLDLRQNHGGSPTEVDRLLGAFIHGKVSAYQCTLAGDCTENHTDDSVPLLNLPLVVLTDRGCASACDHFSAAVKDFGLAPIVGTRTAGVVSGLPSPYLLDDGSMMIMPNRRHHGPNREVINGVGVAPDHYVPLTAKDVSTGRDPAVAKALQLLKK